MTKLSESLPFCSSTFSSFLKETLIVFHIIMRALFATVPSFYVYCDIYIYILITIIIVQAFQNISENIFYSNYNKPIMIHPGPDLSFMRNN